MANDAASSLRDIGNNYLAEFDQSGLKDLESSTLAGAGQRTAEQAQAIGNAAGQQNDSLFDSAAGQTSRAQRGLGVTLSAREQASQDRRFGLAKVLGNVDARNRAMQSDLSNREAVRTNASGLRDIIDQQSLKAFGQSAQMQSDREAEYTQRKAEYRANKAKTIGTLATIGLSFIPVVGPAIAPAIGGSITSRMGG